MRRNDREPATVLIVRRRVQGRPQVPVRLNSSVKSLMLVPRGVNDDPIQRVTSHATRIASGGKFPMGSRTPVLITAK